jgi:hypothetical protein
MDGRDNKRLLDLESDLIKGDPRFRRRWALAHQLLPAGQPTWRAFAASSALFAASVIAFIVEGRVDQPLLLLPVAVLFMLVMRPISRSCRASDRCGPTSIC